MATSATPERFRGLRVMAVDGTVLDVPDSIANAKSLSRFWSPNQSSFSKSPRGDVDWGRDTFNRRCLNLYGWMSEEQKVSAFCQDKKCCWCGIEVNSYAMVHATLTTGCDYLGRVPANAKFSVEKSWWWLHLSWIHPDGKSKKKAVLRFSCGLYTIDTEWTIKPIVWLQVCKISPCFQLYC